MTAKPEFDWTDESLVLFRRQPATAVYTNPFDAIVIRQEGEVVDGSEDPFVMIEAKNVPRLCEALLVQAGFDELADLLSDATKRVPSAAPLSPADRSRRYRQSLKGRDAEELTVTTVTASVTERMTSVTAGVMQRDGRHDDEDATLFGSLPGGAP